MESSVIFLPCTDLAKTTEFYRDICGIDKMEVQSPGKVHIFDTGYGYIGFVQYDDGRAPLSGDKGVCISFDLKDKKEVDDMYLRLKEKGADITQVPMMHKQFPVYSMFISDPDGYKVEFQKIIRKGE